MQQMPYLFYVFDLDKILVTNKDGIRQINIYKHKNSKMSKKSLKMDNKKIFKINRLIREPNVTCLIISELYICFTYA